MVIEMTLSARTMEATFKRQVPGGLFTHGGGCVDVAGRVWQVASDGYCTTVSVNSGTIQLLVGGIGGGRGLTGGHLSGIVLLHMPLHLNFSIFSLKRISSTGIVGLHELVGTFQRLVGVCRIAGCETYTASTVHSTRGNGSMVGGM